MSDEEKWQQLTRRVARKVNIGWWLELLRAPLVISSLFLACAILVSRRELADNVAGVVLAAYATGALLLVAFVTWLVARQRFEKPAQSMVRVEAAMKMRNSLSAAEAGVSPWPEAPKEVNDGTSWAWPRLFIPVFLAVALLTTSLLIPVSARTTDQGPPDEPQAWRELESDIELLSEDDTVQEQYLEKLEEKIEELRKKDDDEWFSHSSLEATDALQKAHRSEVEQLRDNMQKAERSLQAMQKNGGKLGEGARERLLNEFQQALDKMENGAMKPNGELLEQLKGLDPQNLGNLNQEQLDQLRENMREHAEKMGQCEGCQGGNGQGGGAGGEDWIDDLLKQGEGQGNQDGEGNGGEQEGEGNGRGGLQRGPGTNPNVLGNESENFDTGDLEGLESRDLDRTLPGDLLQLMDGEHEVREDKVGIRAGGGVADEGEGGDRVWKDALLPDEKKALKEFFK